MPTRPEGGFTIVEMLIVLLVFGLLMTMTFTVVTEVNTAATGTLRSAAATEQAMIDAEQMAKLIRTAVPCPSTSPPAAAFQVAYGDYLKFCDYPPGSSSLTVYTVTIQTSPGCHFFTGYGICNLVASSVSTGETSAGVASSPPKGTSGPGATVSKAYVYDPFASRAWACAPLTPGYPACGSVDPGKNALFSYYSAGGVSAGNEVCVTSSPFSAGCPSAVSPPLTACSIQSVKIHLSVVANVNLNLPVTTATPRTTVDLDVFLPDVANAMTCP